MKKHGPSNKEIIEKKIRKKDNRKKYVDIERDMINISHSEYIVKYFGYLEDQVEIDYYLDFPFMIYFFSYFPFFLLYNVRVLYTNCLYFASRAKIDGVRMHVYHFHPSYLAAKCLGRFLGRVSQILRYPIQKHIFDV